MNRLKLEMRECAFALQCGIESYCTTSGRSRGRTEKASEESVSDVDFIERCVRSLVILKQRFADLGDARYGGEEGHAEDFMRLLYPTLCVIDASGFCRLVREKDATRADGVLKLLPLWHKEAMQWMQWIRRLETTASLETPIDELLRRQNSEEGKSRRLKRSATATERDQLKLDKDGGVFLTVSRPNMGSLVEFHKKKLAIITSAYEDKMKQSKDETSYLQELPLFQGDIVNRVRTAMATQRDQFLRRHPPRSPESKSIPPSKRTFSKSPKTRKSSDGISSILKEDESSSSSRVRVGSDGVVLAVPPDHAYHLVAPSPSDSYKDAKATPRPNAQNVTFVPDWRHMTARCVASSSDVASAMIRKIERAMRSGVRPQLVNVPCTGGAYFLRDEMRRIVGVFKPTDEEAYAPNNPVDRYRRPRPVDGVPAVGVKQGILVGEAAGREYAAYLLDHERFAGVPVTAMVAMTHPRWNVDAEKDSMDERGGTIPSLPVKIGSLQAYAQHFCSAEDLGYSRFDVEDVHRIAILDMRLLNCDRHAGNILVSHQREGAAEAESLRTVKSEPLPALTPEIHCAPSLFSSDGSGVSASAVRVVVGVAKRKFRRPSHRARSAEAFSPPHRSSARRLKFGDVTRLIPIDHGLCLPRVSDMGEASFEWLRWPQAKKPLSEDMLRFISDLDIEADVALLERERNRCDLFSISDGSLMTLRVSTRWLKLCAAQGMSPEEIGSGMCRGASTPDTPSILEQICAKASVMSGVDLEVDAYRKADMRKFMSAFDTLAAKRVASLALRSP